MEIAISAWQVGLTSLATVKLAARLAKATGMRITPADLFEHPTPREIAREIASFAAQVSSRPQRSLICYAVRSSRGACSFSGALWRIHARTVLEYIARLLTHAPVAMAEWGRAGSTTQCRGSCFLS